MNYSLGNDVIWVLDLVFSHLHQCKGVIKIRLRRGPVVGELRNCVNGSGMAHEES